MTTSQPPQPHQAGAAVPAAASGTTSNVATGATTPSTPVAKPATELTDERAASVGWYFITSYYDFYNSKIDSIHKIYQQNASISHASFPDKSQTEKTVHKASGREAIKARFAEDSQLKDSSNRIIITSAAFEVSLSKNILIIAMGEWSRNDSPYSQFVQTFILTPGKKENIFDVANDVLRFIDFDEFKEKPAPVAAATTAVPATISSTTTAVPQAKADSAETKPEPKTDVKPETKAPAKAEVKPEPVQSESKPEAAKPEPKTESAKPEAKVEVKAETKTDPKADKSETKAEKPETVKSDKVESSKPKPDAEKSESPNQESPDTAELVPATTTPSTASAPSAPISWAALASQAAAAASSAKPAAAAAPVKAAVVKNKKTAASTSASSTGSPVTPPTISTIGVSGAGNKSKKDSFFPIYIRGVGAIKQERIQAHLTKNFGEVKFLQKSDKIALCEFTNAESQEKALQARETVIDSYTISLEPRESKHGGSGYAGYNGLAKSGAGGNAPSGSPNGTKKYPSKDKVRVNNNGSNGGASKSDKFNNGVRKAKPQGRAE